MSKQVDERVVEMQFDNKQFEQGIAQSLKTLERMEKALDQMGASSKGISTLADNLNRMDFSNLSSNVDRIANRFTLLGNLADQFRTRVSNAILDFGKSALTTVTGLTKTGGINRALNIESAQFQLEGLGVEWDKISEDINYGVKSTAYGLDAAAKAASQLVASGVEFGETFGDTGNSPMAKALRGISGVAAMTNSSYEEISRIFTTVAGNGRLMSMQLLQLSSRGLNVAATLGESLGKSEAEIRDMVSKGQISFSMFAEAMDDAFGAHAKDANKTFTGAMSNVKAALSRIGAAVASSAIVDLRDIFNELIPLIDNLKKLLMPTIEKANDLFHHIALRLENIIGYIGDIDHNDTLKNLVTTFDNLGKAAMSFVRPVLQAFGVFTSGNIYADINNVSKALANFSSKLILSEKKGKKLTSTLKMVFKIIKSVVMGVSAAIKVLSPLFKLVTGLVDGIFTFFDTIANQFDKKIAGKMKTEQINNKIESARLTVEKFVDFILRVTSKVPERLAGIVIFVANIVRGIKTNVASLKASEFGKMVGSVVSTIIKHLKRLAEFLVEIGFPVIIAAIGTAIKKLVELIKRIPWKSIRENLRAVFGWLKEHLDELVAFVTKGKFSSVAEVLESIGERLSTFFNGLDGTTQSLDRMSGAINETDKSVGNLFNRFDGVRSTISGFIDKLTGATDAVGEYEHGIFLANVASKNLPHFVDKKAAATISDNLKKMAEGAESFLGAMTKDMGLNPGSIMGLVMGGSGIAVLIGFSRLLNSLADIGKNLAGGFGLKRFLDVVGEGIAQNQKYLGKATLVKSFAISIGIITAAIVALAITASKYDIITPAKVVGSFLVIMAGVLAALMVVSKLCNTNWKSLGTMSVFFIALGATMLLMSKALTNIMSIEWSKLKTKDIILGLGSFGAIIVALVGAMLILSHKSGVFVGNTNANLLSIISVVLAVGLIIRAIKKCTVEDVEKLKKGWLAICGLIITVSASIVGLSFAGKGLLGVGAGIFLLSAGILTVLGVIAIIKHAMEDGESFAFAVAEFFALVIALGGLIAKISQVSKDADKVGKAFMGIGAAIVLIAVGFQILVKTIDGPYDPKSIFAAFVIIAAIIYEFLKLGHLINNGGKNADQFAKTFLALGGSMILIAGAIAILSVLDTKKALVAAGIITVMMIMIAVIVHQIKGAQQALSQLNTGKLMAMGTVFAILVGSLVAIGALMAVLTKEFGGWNAAGIMLVGVLAICGLIIAMAKACDIAGNIASKVNWKGILAMAASYGILTASLLILSKFGDGSDILEAAAGLAGVLIALAYVTKLVDKVAGKKTIERFLLLSSACLIISGAMWILGQANFQNALPNAIAMMAIIGILTVVSNFAKDNVAGAGAIALLSVSLIGIAASLKLLQGVQWDDIKGGLLGIVIAFGALVLLGRVANGAIPGLLAVAGAILIVAATPLVLAVGLYMASKAVDAFADTLVNLGMRAPAIVASIKAIAEGIKAVVFEAIAEMADKLGIFGASFANDARAAAEEAKAAMKEASEEAKNEEAGYQAVIRASQGVSKAEPEMAKAGRGLLDSLKDGLLGSGESAGLSEIGTNLIGGDNGLLGGLTSGFSNVQSLGETGMSDFVGLLDQSETAKQNGGFTLQGFLDGTPSQAFYDQGWANADAYNSGYTSRMDQHSPSRIMMQNGKFTIQGLIMGLESEKLSLDRSAESMASNVQSAFSGVSEKEAKNAGRNVIIGFNNGLCSKDITSKIMANAQSLANNVLSTLRNTFKIHSPSKVTEQYGEYVGQGFEIGIVNSFKKASATFTAKLQWFKEISNDAVKAVANDMEIGGETLTVMAERFGSWIDNMVDPTASLNAARTAITRFIDTNYRQTDAYKDHIKNIKKYEQEIDRLSVDMEGNAQDISDAFDNIKSEAESMAKEAADSFKSLRDSIKSTLTDSVKVLNQSLDSGLKLMEGFEQQAKSVISTTVSALSTYSTKKTSSLYDSLDIFGGFTKNKKKKNQVQVLFDYVKKQIDDVETRVKNIQTLGTRGVSENVLKAIRDMGADADDLINTMLDMTTEQIQEINGYYAKQIDLSKKDESTIISDIFSTITSEIDTVKQHTADMATLAQKGLSSEFLKELNEMGDEGNEMIRGFLAMSESQIREFNKLYQEQQALNEQGTESAVEAAVRTMQENLEKLDKAQANYQAALAKGVNKEFLDSINDGSDEGLKLLAGFANASSEEIASANALWARQQEYANQTLMKNLQETVDDMNDWADMLVQAAEKGIPEGIIAEIAKAGPSAKGYLTALLTMTDTELNNFVALYERAQTLAISSTDTAIAAMAIAGANAGGAFADAIAEYDIQASSEEISNNYISFINGMGVEMNNTAWTVGREVTLNLAKGLLAEDAQAELESAGAASAGSYGSGLSGMSDYAASEMEETNNAVVAGTKDLIDYINEAGLNIDTITLPEVARIISKRLVGIHGELNQQLFDDLVENYNLTDSQLRVIVDMIREDKASDAYTALLTMLTEANNGADDAKFPQHMKDTADEATNGFCNNMENINAPKFKKSTNTAMEAGNDGIFEADMPGAVKGEVDESLTEFNKISSPENVRKNKQGGFDATDAINKGADEAKVPEKIAGIITSISTSVATGLALISQLSTGVAAAGLTAGNMGAQVGDNLADGLASMNNNSNTGKVKKAATDLGNTATRGVQSVCRVASPSKITTWVGTMIGAGLELGMKKSEKGVRKESENLGAESLVAFQTAVKQSRLLSDTISEIPDASPTLTPVLDLDYVKKQASQLNTILDIGKGMTFDMTANIEGSLQRAHEVTYQMNEAMRSFQSESMNQTRMVEDQLNRLRGDINGVSDSIGRMSVMLDSGALVGAISEQVDQQLGRMVNYAERGM